MGETLASFTASEPGRIGAVNDFRLRFGGAETNTAIGLARLGFSVAWISRVGSDPFGDHIVRALRGEGVDTSAVRRDPSAPTALMVKEHPVAGETRVHYWRQGSAASGLTEVDVDAEFVASARWVHLTGITLALGPGPRAAVLRVAAIAKANEIPVSFDANLRRTLTDPQRAASDWREVLPAVSDLLLTEEEARVLLPAADADTALDELADSGLTAVIVKRGERGAIGRCRGERVEVPANGGPAVDVVGAGDAFNVGYLCERLRGSAFAGCLAAGSWVAGRAVGAHGDWEGLPDRAEYDARGTAAEGVSR